MSAVRAFRRGGPALCALLLASPALADWRVSFREGVKASDQERWEEVVRRLASEGVTAYVEVGPGAVLTGLVRKIDRGARLASVENESGLAAVAELL